MRDESKIARVPAHFHAYFALFLSCYFRVVFVLSRKEGKMSRQDKTRAVILQLKAVKDERGISLQRILDLTLASGGNVSMSTVRKVFSEGSENMNFRYEDTIQPIAVALLETNEPPREVSGLVETEAEALKALVQLKNSIIREQQESLDNSRQRETEIKAEAQRKIEHLRSQIEAQKKILDERKEFMSERRDFIFRLEEEKRAQRRTIKVLSIIIAVLALVIFTALLVDKTNSDIGFFWLEETAARIIDRGLWSHTGSVSQLTPL